MKPSLRLLSCLGALGAGSLALTACDASPYAATVGGQEITVNSLNHELAELSANRTFVQDFDANQASQAQQTGARPATVAGTGGSGTFSSAFVDQVLGLDIEIAAVHQYLAAHGQQATADEITAARATQEATGSQFWDQFSPQVRNLLVEQLADEAALSQVPSDPSTLQPALTQIQPYLFSSVCVDVASAFDSAAAQSIASSGAVNGTQVCYSQTDIEGQPAALQSTLRGLTTVGQVSQPVPTSYGFEVLKLVSRTTPGFDDGVKQVLAADTNAPQTLATIVTAAHVKVNPTYGTWSQGQITPPRSPLS